MLKKLILSRLIIIYSLILKIIYINISLIINYSKYLISFYLNFYSIKKNLNYYLFKYIYYTIIST
jgi:hypothetical protein